MEVVVTEEKKKIFRARKTMKISDRQQLESLHSTLLTATPGLSESSPPPPLMNGTHKEDGQKVGDKEQNNVSDSNSPRATSPASPASLSSPAPFLSLNLSPSPPSSQSPCGKEDASPTSPFHSLNFELKKMEDDEEQEEKKKEEKKVSLSSSSNESVTPASTESKENQEEVKEVKQDTETKEAEQTKKDSAVDLEKDSVKGLVPCSSVPSPVSDFTEPMDTDNDTVKGKDPEASTAKTKDEKPPSPKSTASDSSLPRPSSSSHPASSSCVDVKQEKETKEEVKEEEDDKEDVKKGSISEAKMEVDSVKVQTKKEKTEVRQTTKPSRPASTPPSNTVVQEDKGSTSGLKRTLSEGYEKDERPIKREVKRPKVEREELEAQLELKITAKAGSHHKLEKIVQQLVDERLRALQLTIFDKHFEELKERVDKIDCATKHQTAINTLQAKIARLAKKFGEANQASENKRKQEALAAAAAAAAATAAATAAKTATVSNNPQVPRPVRTSMEVKQTPTTVSSSSTAVNSVLSALQASTSAAVPTPTSTAMVTQAPILQLITSTANAASTLATGITTQSPTGTLLLKTAPGSSMMATGQPLLIQLPLSMANGQPGTLVNIPVSSLSAASTLNKSKTTTSTATFILKPAPAITTAPVSAAATVSALQASTGQMSTQISLARAVYQGGAGAITTPNAGVSVTTARTPAQSVSVAGAMSSASSPATSGPAATGSTAPGPPQGTSLTSKTVQNPDPSAVPRELSPPRDEEAGPLNPLSAERRETAKDGTVWAYIEKGEDRGRRQCQNDITEAAGPTEHAKGNIEDVLTAFLCLVDDDMLKHIRDCTVAQAHHVREDKIWDMTVEELKAFIGLVYIRGVHGGKGMDLDSFWSVEWGCAFFKETMSRNRFQEIMRFLCFDKRRTRHTRLRHDKFALMSNVWDGFVQNSIACYNPGANITVDEQLLPTKARCSFSQYMAKKTDKFGIKFWLAVDVDTKYMVNGAPYLGKDETRRLGRRLGESVVLKMVKPYLGKGRNVTTDTFFTSLELAKALQAKETSLVGSVNKSRQELPLCVKEQRPLFSTEVLKSGDTTLTVYQCKMRNNVCILSTVHTAVGISSCQMNKPETVQYYNKTKVGVDVLDQMVRRYSVKAPTGRWPVAVFYNILDLAAINAHILFKKCTHEQVSRRNFIMRLACALRSDHMSTKTMLLRGPGPGQEQQQVEKRRQCQVRRNCRKNKTKDTCVHCHKVVCGVCTGKAEITCVDCVIILDH